GLEPAQRPDPLGRHCAVIHALIHDRSLIPCRRRRSPPRSPIVAVIGSSLGRPPRDWGVARRRAGSPGRPRGTAPIPPPWLRCCPAAMASCTVRKAARTSHGQPP